MTIRKKDPLMTSKVLYGPFGPVVLFTVKPEYCPYKLYEACFCCFERVLDPRAEEWLMDVHRFDDGVLVVRDRNQQALTLASTKNSRFRF